MCCIPFKKKYLRDYCILENIYYNFVIYKLIKYNESMISSELIKGSLKTIILKLLEEQGPLHGYAITRKVEELTGGKIKLTYGALYPVLHKLESEKILVTAKEVNNNRMRIYYALTPKGHSVVTEKIKELKEFIESLQNIIELKPGLNYA